jgi:hypothetical protein
MSGVDSRTPRRHPAPVPHGPLSRRELFPTLVGAVTIVAAAVSLAKSNMAEAQSKTDKKTAKYQDQPNNGQSCSQCNFFRPPKSCQLVDGDISPTGWCSFFAKKP